MSIPTTLADPNRPKLRFRPIKALGHFRKLVANKEDTEQVFLIAEALPSARFYREAKDFCQSARGQELMAKEPWLPSLMDDHDRLLKMPVGSVAHAYVAFMRREGLSAAGLVAESESMNRPVYDDQLQWYFNRLRDTHDLVHVLTGYGRDALGEQCALGYSWGQDHGWMPLFISWAGALELRRRVKVKAPVFSAVRQSQKAGVRASRLIEEDITALLAEQLLDARRRMKIGTPTLYTQSHVMWQSRGINPYDFLGTAAA